MKQNQQHTHCIMHSHGGNRIYGALDITRARNEAQDLMGRIVTTRNRLAALQLGGQAEESELRRLRETIAADAQRYDDLMGAVRLEEGAQAERVAGQFDRRMRDASGRARAAIGGLYRALLTGAQPEAGIRAELSLPTVTTTGTADGGYLLPKTLSDELIREIVEDDSILAEITTTTTHGLEMPRVKTTDVDGDDVDDGKAAPDAGLNADSLIWGRYPYAKNVAVPNSLLADTDTAIESYISARHYEMMRARLCKRLMDKAASGKYTHMSIYHADNAVKAIDGDDLLGGIMKALGDLPTRPAGTYKVALTAAMWMSLIKALANGATALFAAPSKEILGFTPVISNYVDKPIVGNLKTIHLNYDSAISYESERHATLRTTDFVLSTYYDIVIEQPELLRIVNVAAGA